MDMNHVKKVLTGYAYAWLGMFLLAIFTAFMANALYNVPLWQVANVQLGGSLAFIFIVEGILALGVTFAVVKAQWKEALIIAISMIGYGFLCYAALFAFEIYGFFGKVEFKSQSFVVQDMYGFLSMVLEPVYGLALGKVPGESVDRWIRITSIFLVVISGAGKILGGSSQKQKAPAAQDGR